MAHHVTRTAPKEPQVAVPRGTVRTKVLQGLSGGTYQKRSDEMDALGTGTGGMELGWGNAWPVTVNAAPLAPKLGRNQGTETRRDI